jgi:hypothetical protein
MAGEPMRRFLYPVLIAAGLVAAVSTPVAAAPPGSATSVVARTSAAAPACYSTNWPRPRTAIWQKDPCADSYVDYYVNGALVFEMLAGVDYKWSMAGGPHIVATRGWGRFTSYSSTYPTGRVTEVRLGRVEPFSGVLTTNTTDSAWSKDSIQHTAEIPGVGCGSADGRRIGTTSYQLRSHMFGEARSSGGTVPDDFTGLASYYYFATDGKC